MKIQNIQVKNEGYVYCKSNFYSVQDVLEHNSTYTFFTGINELIGEIDSGNWAISYLLSMYRYRTNDFILFEKADIIINNKLISLDELATLSCYMDKLYPLFSTNETVENLVLKGLEINKINLSGNYIKSLFHLDDERYKRPLTGVGNEIYNAMAAIGYCYKKELFCFPWLSKKRFDGYHKNLTDVLNTLKDLNKTIIIPIGY